MGIQLFDAHPLGARHRADAFPCGALLTKPMDSMLQMRKPRHREAKKKKKACLRINSSKWVSWDLIPSEPVSGATEHTTPSVKAC